MTDEEKEIIHKITIAHMDELDLIASYWHYKVFGEIKLIKKDSEK